MSALRYNDWLVRLAFSCNDWHPDLVAAKLHCHLVSHFLGRTFDQGASETEVLITCRSGRIRLRQSPWP